jgi:subtilisin family serine protease
MAFRMRYLLTIVLVLTLALSLGLSTAAGPAKTTALTPPLSEVHNREILVQVDPVRGTKAVSKVLSSHGVAQVRVLPLSYATYQIVRVPEGQDYHATLAALQADPAVKCAGPNVIKHVSATLLNDPLLLNGAGSVAEGLETPYAGTDQWGLLISGAPTAWDETTGSSNVIVAVLDTGINFNHEDIVHRTWVNSDEVAGNGIDDDSNGFVDDTRGYDFSSWVVGSGGGDNDPSDPSGEILSHGMCTASIIAAEGNNNKGMAGVAGGNSQASGIRLMILRVGTESTIQLDSEIGAIDYAVKNGAKVISMSFGGETGLKPESDAIENAWQAGVLCIAASGNTGAGNRNQTSGTWYVDLPAGFTHCMAIGATTIFNTRSPGSSSPVIDETLADYSKYVVDPHNDTTTGQPMHGVDVCAPGTGIIGALNDTTGYVENGQFTGTSAATPIVAGLAGLLLSKNPALTASNLRDYIRQGAMDLGTAGVDEMYGYGRIAMRASMDLVAGGKVGDTNRDNAVNDLDIAPIIAKFGIKRGESGYDSAVDCNNDGVIDELDVFVVGRHYGG